VKERRKNLSVVQHLFKYTSDDVRNGSNRHGGETRVTRSISFIDRRKKERLLIAKTLSFADMKIMRKRRYSDKGEDRIVNVVIFFFFFMTIFISFCECVYPIFGGGKGCVVCIEYN